MVPQQRERLFRKIILPLSNMTGFSINIPQELRSPSEAFLRASESIGLYWWYWEKSNGKLIISPGLLKILGVSPESYDGLPQSVYSNIHPEDLERNQTRVDQLYRGEDELYEIEYRIKDLQGEWQWYYNRGSVLQKDSRGKALVIGGISMDISGPFTKLLAMVEEKEKFEFIFRHSTEAILVLEVEDGKVVRVRDANRAALELFQRSEKDILSNVPVQFSSDDMLGTGGLMLKQIQEKGFARFEKKIKVGRKEDKWLEFTAHKYSLTGEDLILVIVADKTPRKKAEAALRETERLYRTLFEAANDRIGLYTLDGKAMLLNSAFYESLGYTREEFMNLDQYNMVHPKDRDRLDLEGKELHEKGYSAHEYRVLHKNGTYLHMSSKIVLIKGEEGEEDLVLFIMRDISERKQSMKELERAKERAVESDKLKSAFLANMSHEIRTPMNSIIGFSNLLNKADMDSDERELYVNRIVSNSESLLMLITDIIDLAKIESGQVTMNYGRLLLSDLIAEMKQHAYEEARRLRKENLEIHTKVEVGDCEVEADVLRLTQVLKNLINNAIKFTAEGSVEIGCKLGDSGQTVLLYVRDTGIGVAPEHFDLIFDQFRQVDGSNTRKFGGTGLGLAICQNLVQLMGGRIWVESEPGSGSLFLVELPLELPRIKKQHQPPVEKVSHESESKHEISILAVDDEPHTLELYQAMLNGMGYSVRTAPNAYEALRMLEQFQLPDLVLMDVQMPVLSGTDTLRIIRERHPDVKVVAQSAHALVGDRDRFLKEGYDEYLPKPFTTKQMEKVVSNLRGK
jgi:PAS domain S-box-containing protein